MPCEADLDKAKREFSFLGKPEVYDKIYAFSGFKINNIYNKNTIQPDVTIPEHKIDIGPKNNKSMTIVLVIMLELAWVEI